LTESFQARGGDAALNSSAVPDISSVGRPEEKTAPVSTSPVAQPAAVTTPTPAPAPVVQQPPPSSASGPRPEDNKAFSLTATAPSKVRTGGKKKTWCTIL
jgi:hypothetical protein